ncbi:MAG: YegS/Rv2252/BmrU family lipid kinase [Clostridiaceae bacterium]
MKKVKFIYNPSAGGGVVLDSLDDIIKVHQNNGYIVIPCRIDKSFEIDRIMEDINDGYSHLLVAGGDGTVDLTINHMMKLGINLPIGILPTGTANDFSKYIGMPSDLITACEQIFSCKPIKMDLGKVNDRYFINVASSGLFTDVSQKTDEGIKQVLGKLAYYLKGIEQVPNFRKIPICITSLDGTYDGDIYSVLIFNGQTAGNFKLAYKAKINDGKLDVIIIKGETIGDLITFLYKYLKGDHLEGPVGLSYFQTNEILIETPNSSLGSDIDGEKGPDFPLLITCVKEAITVLGVKADQFDSH